ncbi:hypothetical protein N9045_00265 [bacterium]|nr:hypothetical protein [bacterium]
MARHEGMKKTNIARKIGIKWEEVDFDKEQFNKGLAAEMKEHAKDPETKVINTVEEAAKIAWAHLKEDPKYYDKLKQLEESYIKVIAKIDSKDVTAQDFSSLIEMRRSLNESTPSSIRDRIRRRVSPSNKANRKKHDQDGHRNGSLNVAGRVQPKRKPSGQAQMNGRGKAGHRHSTRKQRRNAAAVEDKRGNIAKQIGHKLSEQILKAHKES